MSHSLILRLAVFFCFLLMLVQLPQTAEAAIPNNSICSNYFNAAVNPPGVAVPVMLNEAFTGVIVTCMEGMITRGAQNFIGQMVLGLRPFLLAAMTLAVTWFGVQLALGMIPKPTAPAVTLAIKIGLLFWVLSVDASGVPVTIMRLYQALTGLMQMLMAAATQIFSQAATNIQTDPVVAGTCVDTTLPVTYQPWARMDCLLGKIFGFPTTIEVRKQAVLGVVTPPNTVRGLTQGILLLLGAIFLTGTAGIFAFMVAVSTLVAVLIAVYRAVFNYVLAIIMLMILFAILPLILPAVFFKVTERFFSSWLKMVIAYAIQPIMLFAFLPFFFVVMEMLLFDNQAGNIVSLREVMQGILGAGVPRSPFYAGAAAQNALSPDIWDFSYLLWDPNAGVIRPTTITMFNFQISPEWFDNMNVSMINPLNPFDATQRIELPLEDVLKGAADTVNGLFSAVKIALSFSLADWGPRHTQVVQEIMLVFVSMGITAYVMIKILNYMPQYSSQLIGGQFVQAPPSTRIVENTAFNVLSGANQRMLNWRRGS